MPNRKETVKLDGIDKREAERIVKEKFIERYGEGNVRSFKAMGDPVISAKGYDDKVRIGDDGTPGAVVDVTNASATTQGIIESMDFNAGESASHVVERAVNEYETEQEEGTGIGGSRTRSGESNNGTSSDRLGKHDVVDYGDGSIRFRPRYTQKEASYLFPGDDDYDDTHKACESCAHFIEGGGCHMVEGPIDLDGYCEEFYADVGVYGHKHPHGIEENLSLWGWEFDWDEGDAAEFAMDIRERLQQKVRGMR